ncbi:hypothetical protein LCGC14_2940790 [marine sediment metagenome]|uniref:Uncharacterized protein n=1 Tax=marine sediment metagenome TaxID=412755 RepID=A0A0F8ZQU2_9ZZZZ
MALDFEGMLQRELDRQRRLAAELDDELLFQAHYKTDQEFLRQCGIAWPLRS